MENWKKLFITSIVLSVITGFCGFMAQIDFVFVAYAEIPNKGRSFFKCGFWRWCSSSDARQTPEFEEDGKKPAPSPPAGAGSKKEDTHSGFWGETCGFITDLYDPKDSKPDIGGRDFSRNLFRHMNLAGAIPIMIGASFAFACAGQCFMQVVAILDRKKCGLKALNITTATLAVVCTLLGVIMMSILYFGAISTFSANASDKSVSDMSNAELAILEKHGYAWSQASKQSASGSWVFGFCWFGLASAIASLITTCLACFCCSDK